MQHLDLNFYVHSCGQMAYKRGFRPSEVQCPQTQQWAPLDREALASLDEEPEALLARGLAPGEAERLRAARRLDAQRALRLMPAVMTRELPRARIY